MNAAPHTPTAPPEESIFSAIAERARSRFAIFALSALSTTACASEDKVSVSTVPTTEFKSQLNTVNSSDDKEKLPGPIACKPSGAADERISQLEDVSPEQAYYLQSLEHLGIPFLVENRDAVLDVSAYNVYKDPLNDNSLKKDDSLTDYRGHIGGERLDQEHIRLKNRSISYMSTDVLHSVDPNNVYILPRTLLGIRINLVRGEEGEHTLLHFEPKSDEARENFAKYTPAQIRTTRDSIQDIYPNTLSPIEKEKVQRMRDMGLSVIYRHRHICEGYNRPSLTFDTEDELLIDGIFHTIIRSERTCRGSIYVGPQDRGWGNQIRIRLNEGEKSDKLSLLGLEQTVTPSRCLGTLAFLEVQRSSIADRLILWGNQRHGRYVLSSEEPDKLRNNDRQKMLQFLWGVPQNECPR